MQGSPRWCKSGGTWRRPRPKTQDWAWWIDYGRRSMRISAPGCAAAKILRGMTPAAAASVKPVAAVFGVTGVDQPSRIGPEKDPSCWGSVHRVVDLSIPLEPPWCHAAGTLCRTHDPERSAPRRAPEASPMTGAGGKRFGEPIEDWSPHGPPWRAPRSSRLPSVSIGVGAEKLRADSGGVFPGGGWPTSGFSSRLFGQVR